MEFDGETTRVKFPTDLARYLREKHGWIGMIIFRGAPRTIVLSHVVEYIKNDGLKGGKKFALVRMDHVERFRKAIQEQRI